MNEYDHTSCWERIGEDRKVVNAARALVAAFDQLRQSIEERDRQDEERHDKGDGWARG